MCYRSLSPHGAGDSQPEHPVGWPMLCCHSADSLLAVKY